MTASLTPDFKDTPWWWEAAPPLGADALPADLTGETEVLVVGAGFTGLHAARTLARGGVRVAVIDKGAIGIGASTRNGGSAVAAIKKHFLKDADKKSWGDRLMAEMRAAYDHMETVLQEDGIAAYTGRVGRLVGAHSPRAFDALAREAEEIGRWFEGGAEVIGPERIRDELASPYYHGGVLTHQAGGVHPALYHRGLVETCQRLGVRLFPETAALRWSGGPGGFRVTTPRGEIRAAQLVLATNGYTDGFSGWHRRRIVPIESHMIATEPLGEDRLRALMPAMRVYGDTKRVPFYFRPCPENRRLLFGGRASFGQIAPRKAAEVLLGYAREVFPTLGDLRVTHAWKGFVGFTFDFVPHIGTHRGIHYAMGCNGGGVVPLSWLGHKLGERLLDPQAEPSVFSHAPFVTRPGYTGTPWFLPMIGRVYQYRDRLDRMNG